MADAYQVRQAINLYYQNPSAWSFGEIDQLEQLANQLEVPFQRDVAAHEASLLSQVAGIPGQFASGFLHGFSTIPVGPDPRGDV